MPCFHFRLLAQPSTPLLHIPLHCLVSQKKKNCLGIYEPLNSTTLLLLDIFINQFHHTLHDPSSIYPTSQEPFRESSLLLFPHQLFTHFIVKKMNVNKIQGLKSLFHTQFVIPSVAREHEYVT